MRPWGRLDRLGRKGSREKSAVAWSSCLGCGGRLERAHRYGMMGKANVSASLGPGVGLLTVAGLGSPRYSTR